MSEGSEMKEYKTINIKPQDGKELEEVIVETLNKMQLADGTIEIVSIIPLGFDNLGWFNKRVNEVTVLYKGYHEFK